MEFKELVTRRYSCKKYGDSLVADDTIASILEVARHAPTAKNLQEQHVYVIKSEEGLAKVDELTPCRYGAPVVLMVAFSRKNVFTYPGGKRNSGIEDASIVATHLVLAAADAGVDSCWVNNFNPEKPPRPSACPRTRRSSCCSTSATPPRARARWQTTPLASPSRRP